MSGEVLELTRQALWLVLLLSAPPIIAASVVGLLVAFLQAATQLQEQTFSFTVKFIAVVVTLFITAALLGGTLYTFADRLFVDFPGLVRR
ncbi:MAG: type III secretion system export apparatus subunit SctS [Lysobacteraceae bacterium]